MKKIISILVTLSFLLSPLASAAGLFNTYFTSFKPLGTSLTYTAYQGETESGKKQRVYMLDYTPSEDILPMVSWGDTLLSRKTLTSMMKSEKSAVAGVNADFFSFYTGIPMGVVISDGLLVSSDAKAPALGIFPDGSVITGYPSTESVITFVPPPVEEEVSVEETPIEQTPIEEIPVEEVPTEETPVEEPFFEEITEPVPVSFTAYYNKYPTVWAVYLTDSKYSKTTSSTIPSREIVVSVDGEMKLGTTLTLTVEQVFSDTQNTEIPDGKMVLTVPNALKNSDSFSTLAEGDTMTLTLKCADGWEGVQTAFSGGDIIVENSAFVPETVNEDHEKYRNARTAVGIRENGTLFFMCVDYTDESAGMTLSEVAQFMIDNGAVTALNLDGGGSTTVAVNFLDSDTAMVVNTPSDASVRQVSNAVLFVNKAEDVSLPAVADFGLDSFILAGTSFVPKPVFYSASGIRLDTAPTAAEYVKESADSVIENGVYFSAPATYTERLFGSFQFDGTVVKAEAVLNVTDTLDEFYLNKSGIMLRAGDRVTLEVFAKRYNKEVLVPFDALSFKDLESESDPLVEEGYLFKNDYVTVDKNGVLTSLDAPQFTRIALEASWGEYTDTLTLYFDREDEITEAFDEASLQKFYSPESKARANGYRTDTALAAKDGGFVYTEPVPLDVVPEYFTVSIKGSYDNTLYLALRDGNGEDHLFPYYVYKDYSSISGWTELIAPIGTSLEGEVSIVSPLISEFEEGIIADSFTSHYGFNTDPFSDIGGIWSHDYITRVYDMGLVNGYNEEGKLIFKPENNITRAEFSKMLVTFLGFDTRLYQGYGSSFADEELIPEWAGEYVRAVSTEGFMNGRLNSDGTLTFDAQSYITRAEAMTVFSKLVGDLTMSEAIEFADDDTIPDWAKDAIVKTVSAGIVTGFDDGTVRASDNVTRAQMCVMFTRLWDYKNT